MEIQKDRVVELDYVMTNGEGKQLDSSASQGPLVYLHGHNDILPGIESQLAGKTKDDKISVTLEPKEAFGEVNRELVQTLPPEAFEGVDKIDVGMQFEANDNKGNRQLITVQDVSDDGIVVNLNHPLAGETLTFDITVLSVREAEADEISHGHAHS